MKVESRIVNEDTQYKCVECGEWEFDVNLDGLCMCCHFNEDEKLQGGEVVER